MKITRRTAILGASASILMPHVARAAWPEKMIAVVHGFSGGGNADVFARMITDQLAMRLKQRAIVDPRPGAGGNTAAAQVSRAEPDGYTLFLMTGGHTISAAFYKSLPYNSLEGFSYIGLLAEYPFVYATYPDNPIKTGADLIREARTRSQPLNFGTAGNGTTQHMSAVLLAERTGAQFSHVPYRGSAQSTVDLMAKRLDFVVEAPASIIEHIKAGKALALAVTSKDRFFAIPDVPTFAEGGVEDCDVTTFLGLAGPPNIPSDVVKRLNDELREIIVMPEFVERAHALGNEVLVSTPDAFRSRVADDIMKWKHVVETAKIEKI
jgi:tripartite-type tricarboxylate transporter receptor subunit TctC